MDKPLVSVICACYNQESFVLEGLNSVKNQTYKNLEIIIWDDASTDNSVSIIENWIKEHPHLDIIFTKNTENKGICKSLNEAHQLSSGRYFQLLALDDFLLADKIERHVTILEESAENQALVFSDVYLINEYSEMHQNRFIAYHKKYLNLETGNYYRDLLQNNYIPAMSILYKRKIFETVGNWDETLVYEDYDMLLRIAKNFDFIFDHIPSAKYRFHSNNTHKIISKSIEESKFKVYLKHLGYSEHIDRIVKSVIIQKYLDGSLAGEQVHYFDKISPKNRADEWILQNKKQWIYKIVDRLLKIRRKINP